MWFIAMTAVPVDRFSGDPFRCNAAESLKAVFIAAFVAEEKAGKPHVASRCGVACARVGAPWVRGKAVTGLVERGEDNSHCLSAYARERA